MGYYTKFTLRVDTPDSIPGSHGFHDFDVIADMRKDDYFQYVVDSGGDSIEAVKFYGYMGFILEYSRKYPKHFFSLYGEGEESGDIWVLYARNGKCVKHKGRITYPEFNEGDLK